MEKGYREILNTKLPSGEEGKVFIIKRKNWQEGTMTMARKNNNTFIIGQPCLFRRLCKEYKNKSTWDLYRVIQFLHELGHLGDPLWMDNIPFKHFFKENFATIRGFILHRKKFKVGKILKYHHLILFLIKNLKYTIYGKTNS